MSEVFICEGFVRRLVATAARCRRCARTISALVLRELMKRNASLDPQAVGDVILGCANQAGEDNRMCSDERPPGWTADRGARGNGQSFVRLGDGCIAGGSRMILAGEAEGCWQGYGEYESGTLCHVQGCNGLRARRANVRYHHRLALHQSRP